MFQMLLPLASKMLTTKVMMSAGAKMMLSAGASALGTHLDNQQIKKQNRRAAAEARARQGNFYVNLRNAAQRAGFNPLTVLRSGTAGAYQAEGNSYDVLPMLTSNSFAKMLMNAEESQVRMDNMRAQERNMQHQQNMDKLNYELRKAEMELNQKLTSQKLIDDLEQRPLPVDVAAKNWRQLTANIKTPITNAENIKAQSKIEGMKDTTASIRFLGLDWYGSGAMSSGAAMEESLGNNWLLEMPLGVGMIGDMVGSKIKDWTHGNRAAEAKMRRIYRNVHADQIIRALETNSNAARLGMKPTLQPPLSLNHMMTLPY
jgi:hypothetical protein